MKSKYLCKTSDTCKLTDLSSKFGINSVELSRQEKPKSVISTHKQVINMPPVVLIPLILIPACHFVPILIS